MKNNHFLQIAALALCLIVVFSTSYPVTAYERLVPWEAYDNYRIDHNGPGNQGTGSWYRYSSYTEKPGAGAWGQFTCKKPGYECGVGGHATGWNWYSANPSWQPEGSYQQGPFQGPALYDADCNCYIPV